MVKEETNIILAEVTKSLKTFFEPRNVKPTLRTMFYRLYSLGFIPNTKYSYRKLGKLLVKARQEGIISWDSFADGARRRTIGGVDRWKHINDYMFVYRESHVEKDFPDPEEEACDIIQYIKTVMEEGDYHVGRWKGQPNYVEVWIEKDAIASSMENILKDRDVYIAVNKGYSSWTFLYENCKRLLKQYKIGKEVHIIYIGDFDPSGVDMQNGHLMNALRFFGLSNVIVERVSVTLEQIKKYNIPEMPSEPQTIEKANRDPRLQKFVEEHGRLILVEVDAMLAVAPDDFTDIILKSVDDLFDQSIYEKTKQLEHKCNELKINVLKEHIRIV